jgi:hypothetical protein
MSSFVMSNIDDIFNNVPLCKEACANDDAEQFMKFCIVAHMAPNRIRLTATGETYATRDFCQPSFKKLYRVLDTLPFIVICYSFHL